MPPPSMPNGNPYALVQQQAPPAQQPSQQPGAQGNPVPQYQQNTQMLRNFMLDYFKQHPIKREDIPVIEGKPIDLTRFFAEVYGVGGYEKVSFSEIMMIVASF
jgi:hypothetical protein